MLVWHLGGPAARALKLDHCLSATIRLVVCRLDIGALLQRLVDMDRLDTVAVLVQNARLLSPAADIAAQQELTNELRGLTYEGPVRNAQVRLPVLDIHLVSRVTSPCWRTSASQLSWATSLSGWHRP